MPFVGHSNETEVEVNGKKLGALIDTGSMVTTICQSSYCTLVPKPQLHALSDFSLDISGANGAKVPYIGYSILDITIPNVDLSSFSVPVLIVPDTKYSTSVPMIVGTNVLTHVRSSGVSGFPSAFQNAFASLAGDHTVPVTSMNERVVVVKPFETATVTGKVRSVGKMSVGVTEPHDSSNLNICPRLVKVSSGTSFSRIPVRICNLTARPLSIFPRTSLCNLQDVEVVRTVDPAEGCIPRSHNQDKSLDDLGITIPSDTLSKEQIDQARAFLSSWKHIFSSGPTDLGCTNLVEHGIELTDPIPFKEPYRRIPPGMFEEVREHLKDMLEAGAIRPSQSPFSSNIVLVRKKDGSLRFCIDYRKLNNRTVKDAYALPRIEETIDSLVGSRFFSKLDLRSGYWQVAMKEQDKCKTAFQVGPLGFFECNRMAFGLTNAPATFQRLMERCMGELHLKECLIYLDDIIIFSDSIESHFRRLDAVFKRLEKAGLKLKGTKCEFFQTQVNYLGHVVSQNGVETDPDKLKVLKDWPVPTCVKELRSFLSFSSYYRRFVPGFAQIAKPLNDLLVGHPTNKKAKTSKPAVSWTWGQKQQEAFTTLIDKLTSPPILAYADYSKPFILNVDASCNGLGAVLYQEHNGKERVVAYASRGLRANERNYPVHKLEFLALKWSICDKFHDYLYGNSVKVRTDNNPLTYVFSSAKLDAMSHRWLAALSAYDIQIHYRSGKQNLDADVLSRLPKPDNDYKVLFSDAIKALLQAHSSVPESLPAMECVSFAQQVLKDNPSDIHSIGTSFQTVDWKDEQAKDPAISRVIEILRAGHRLTERQRASEPSAVRKFLKEWNSLFFKDGVLFRKGSLSGFEVHQLVLPECFYDRVFHGLHDEAGHQGRDRTISLLKSRFYWPQIDQFVEHRIRNCHRCIHRKTLDRNAAKLVSVESHHPMELVCMDFLSLEMSSGGFENILIITDHFTRFSQALPSKNQTARTTAKLLFDSFISHYGFPSRLHSDQGRNFESEVIRELCKLAGVEKTRTTPYHPQGNGMPERFNETLLNMLGTLEEEQKSNWKAHLPTMVHAFNSTRHDSTGFTPHFLMFGRHPRLAIDAVLGIEPDKGFSKDKSSYVSDLKNRLQFAYKVASREARKQGLRHKKRYDLRVREAKLEVGDRVLVRNVGIRGKNKLADRWEKDVHVVVDQPDPDLPVYNVKREHGQSQPRLLHRNLLLPFMGIPLQIPTSKQSASAVTNVSGTSDIADSEEQVLDNQTSDHSTDNSALNTSHCSNHVSFSDNSDIQKDSVSSEKYVIPARRPLNPSAQPFQPRSTRTRAKPKWMASDDWHLT